MRVFNCSFKLSFNGERSFESANLNLNRSEIEALISVTSSCKDSLIKDINQQFKNLIA